MTDKLQDWLDRQVATERTEAKLLKFFPSQSKQAPLLNKSFMSLVPEFVCLDEPSIDPKRLIEFSEQRLGLQITKNLPPSQAVEVMKPFSKAELKAAFTLKGAESKEVRNDTTKKRKNIPGAIDSLTDSALPGAHLPSKVHHMKRVKYIDALRAEGPKSRSSSPVPLTVASTVEAQSPTATPAKGITTGSDFLPVAKPPPLPSGDPPPLPSGPPPTRKMSVTSPLDVPERILIVFDDEQDEKASQNTFSPSTGSIPEEEDDTCDIESGSESVNVPEALSRELIRISKALVEIKDWPSSTATVIESFEQSGYPFGNPFLPPALKQDFDEEDSCANLRQIIMKVEGRSEYKWFYQFESELRLLVGRLRMTHETGIMATLIEHFAKIVERELSEGLRNLRR